MARKLMATLKVYIADTTEEGITHTARDGEDYEIVLSPARDLTNGATEKDFPSILAHELGHFAAMVGKAPEHAKDKAITLFFGAGFRPQIYRAEKEAWNLADKMNLKIRPSIRKQALDSYKVPR